MGRFLNRRAARRILRSDALGEALDRYPGLLRATANNSNAHDRKCHLEGEAEGVVLVRSWLQEMSA